jgi:hypothetical protein
MIKLKQPSLSALTLLGSFEKTGLTLKGEPWKLFIIKFIDHVGTPYELKDFVDQTQVRSNSRLHKALINLGCRNTKLKAVTKFIKERAGCMYIAQTGTDAYSKRVVLPGVKLLSLDDIAI